MAGGAWRFQPPAGGDKMISGSAIEGRAHSGEQRPPSGDLPFLWPLALVGQATQNRLALTERNLRFAAEASRLRAPPAPGFPTPNRVILKLRTLWLRDYSCSTGEGEPAIVIAPYAGHTATIADYQRDQSLVGVLLANGVGRVVLTDWRSATADMKDFDIDQYLAELNVCVDDVGGRVKLIGLCQGGWLGAMYAARFPAKVAKLVLAGAPIDTDAGDGPVKRMAHAYPMTLYERLVAAGGGLMRGDVMLAGWKGMHPVDHALRKHAELYRRLDEPEFLRRTEAFASWYETTLDLPGRWYLQVIRQIFKENRLAKGRFVGLGRRLHLRDVTCPAYLLAGEADDVTTAEQVFNAERLLGTPAPAIEKRLVPGGHIGLFMGSKSLTGVWPEIARWLASET